MNIREGLINKKALGSGGGGSTDVQQLNATSNGTYIAGDGTAYSPVIVNVPNPSSGEIEITENGTYDVTEKASAVVNVSGGGTTPTKGFMPTEWDNDGYVTGGKLFGLTGVPDRFFFNNSATSGQYPHLVSFYSELPIGRIGSYAFSYCGLTGNIQDLISNLHTIGTYAFSNARFKNLVLPSTIQYVESQAFSSSQLESIAFNSTPITLAGMAFNKCTKLTTINVPWSEGDIPNAPWGATNATINYNYEG